MNIFELIRNWSDERNITKGATAKDQALKGVSEFGELADAVLQNDMPKIIDGIGDVAVVLTIMAHQYGLTIEDCIQAAYDEIKDRKGVMYNGAFIKSTDDRYNGILAELAGLK